MKKIICGFIITACAWVALWLVCAAADAGKHDVPLDPFSYKWLMVALTAIAVGVNTILFLTDVYELPEIKLFQKDRKGPKAKARYR